MSLYLGLLSHPGGKGAFGVLICVGLVLAQPVSAWGWFTHAGIDTNVVERYDLPDILEEYSYEFIMGSSIPDTTLMGHRGEWSDYLHDIEFAEILLEIAENDAEMVVAYGVGSHIIADNIGHPRYVHLKDDGGESGPIHTWTEYCVDVLVFYDNNITDIEIVCDTSLISRFTPVGICHTGVFRISIRCRWLEVSNCNWSRNGIGLSASLVLVEDQRVE